MPKIKDLLPGEVAYAHSDALDTNAHTSVASSAGRTMRVECLEPGRCAVFTERDYERLKAEVKNELVTAVDAAIHKVLKRHGF